MESRLQVGGHPLHPMLVLLPVGLLVWAFVAYLVYAAADSMTWYDIGFWTTWAGVVTMIPAAVAGMVDYATVARRVQFQLATLHMVLNLAALALFAVSAVIAIDEGATGGLSLAALLGLQAIGLAALGISGWIGQEMVYRQGLAVAASRSAPPAPPETMGQRPAAGSGPETSHR